MEVIRKNIKEDIKMLVSLGDNYSGQAFEIVFSVGKFGRQKYRCSYNGSVYSNCASVDSTHVMCYLDNHDFSCGLLYCEVTVIVPDSSFADGNQRKSSRRPVVTTDGDGNQYNIELVNGVSDDVEYSEVTYDLLQNFIKGEKGLSDAEHDALIAATNAANNKLAEIASKCEVFDGAIESAVYTGGGVEVDGSVEAIVAGAEKVNATLSGTTLSVTNRNGVVTSVNTKGEKGEKGDKGDKGNSGVTSTDGVEVWNDLSSPSAIPDDTAEKVNVAGAKAVATAVTDLAQKVGEMTEYTTEDDVAFDFNDDKSYYEKNGNVIELVDTEYDYYTVKPIEISNGEYTIHTKHGTSSKVEPISIVDEGYNLLESYGTRSMEFVDTTITISNSSAKYMLITCYTKSIHTKITKKNVSGIKEKLSAETARATNAETTLLNRIVGVENSSSTEEVSRLTLGVTENKVYKKDSSNKVVVEDTTYAYAAIEPISVKRGDKLKVTTAFGTSSNVIHIGIVDKNYNLLASYGTESKYVQSVSVEVTDDIACWCLITNTGGSFEIEKTSKVSIADYVKNTIDTKLMDGLNVAIIGDSVSTNGDYKEGNDGNIPEVVIDAEDVGKTLSAYVTYNDVAAELVIGGHTFTEDEIGNEVSFVPTSEDIGKFIGKPKNKNTNSVKVWWEWCKEVLGFTAIPVCWSGSSICSHEGGNNVYKTSYAWHPAQLRKCGIRTKGTMERVAPDVIIIARGMNDMTHSPYARLTSGYFDGAGYLQPNTDVLEDGNYGFKEAYVMTILKLRELYPKAKIFVCCPRAVKRRNYEHFPNNNGLYTMPQFDNAIREIGNYMGCSIINFDKAGITLENVDEYADDGVHPNNAGHKLLGMRAIADIKAQWCNL